MNPTPIVPALLEESRHGIKSIIRQLQAKVDMAAELAITESEQRIAHVAQVAARVDNLQSESEKVAIQICQKVEGLDEQMCSIEHGHGQVQQQISQLQRTGSTTQSELAKLQNRVDEIQMSSSGAASMEVIKLLPCKVQEVAPCDPIQSKDFVRHLMMVKSEAEEVKSVLGNRIQVLEKRLESVERNFTVGEGIHQLQAESCRIISDMNTIKEDVKKHLEDIKQQIAQMMSLVSAGSSELGPTATAGDQGQHVPSTGMPEMEVSVRYRRQAVPGLTVQEGPISDVSSTNTLSDISESTTSRENRASRASSGYYSVSSSRPPSIARSESNASLTQRLSQFSLEEALEEEEIDQKAGEGSVNRCATDPAEPVLLDVLSRFGSDGFFTPPTSQVSPSAQHQ